MELYQRPWDGQPVGAKDDGLSADEKSQLQILVREGSTLPPSSHRPIRVEYEYDRRGTVAYLAAMDVAAGTIFGRVDDSTGIVPCKRLVELVMDQEPYASADRVFWIVDNGSSQYTTTFPPRLKAASPKAIALHLPIHAGWLNQIEISFSILQRKALTPTDRGDRDALEEWLLGFQERYNRTAQPFQWRFTRQNLEQRMKRWKLAA
ncbi:MAG: transposase [Candidatus Latescibacteria bacterium]|nr:transposase [Candidatus Latescibacterota bacterium]